MANPILGRGLLIGMLAAGALPGLADRASGAPKPTATHWVAAWSASPMPADASPDGVNTGFSNETLREVAQLGLGGRRLRVRLSNAYGAAPLRVDAAHAALGAGAAGTVPGSDRALSFNGAAVVVIPAGASVLSDPLELEVTPFADLAVSLYFSQTTGPVTWHQLATQTSFISTPGDATAAVLFPLASTTTSLYVLSGVEVEAPRDARAVVVLGDSLTDGYGSTVDAHHRWTDFLARRLAARKHGGAVAVLNGGISGNRLLHDVVGPNALARFDRDVLGQAGVTRLVVLEGINDLGLPGYLRRPAEEVGGKALIGALRQLIARAHAQRLKIYGATLTPFEGSGEPYYSPSGEAQREVVNAWIRSSGEFDAILDFDRLLRDPDHPGRLLPAYDGGDHLHPNDAGYAAMAGSVELALF